MIAVVWAGGSCAAAPNPQRLKEYSVTITTTPGSREDIKLSKSLITCTIDSEEDPLFNRDMLRDPSKGVALLQSTGQMGDRTLLSLYSNSTSDNIVMDTVFFNRGSRTLVVVVPGLFRGWSQQLPCLKIFDQYDLLMFDQRGAGYSGLKSDDPIIKGKDVASLGYNCERPYIKDLGSYLKTDTKYWGWGDVESEDVRLVIEHYRNQKQQSDQVGYDQVIGVGLCYSAYVFARAQSQLPTLFDKLILDGVTETPTSTFSAPNNRRHVREFFDKITIPIMLVHGAKDECITQWSFNRIASAVRVPYIVFNSHTRHVVSLLHEPEAYKTVSNMFIDYFIEECAAILKNANNGNLKA